MAVMALSLILLFQTSRSAGTLVSPPPSLEEQAATIGLLASTYSAARSRCCGLNTTQQQNPDDHETRAAAPSPKPLVTPNLEEEEYDDIDLDKLTDETDTVACYTSDDCKIALHDEAFFCLTFPNENGTCRPRLPQGGACRHDYFCQQGLICSQPGQTCVDQSERSQIGGFCIDDSSCEGAANICDFDSGRCISAEDQAIRRAASRTSSLNQSNCGAVEKAECYDRCKPYTKKEILLCSYCCLDCEFKISCAKAKRATAKPPSSFNRTDVGPIVPRHVIGPLLRP